MCLYAVALVFIVSIFVKIFPLKHNNEILSAEDAIISVEGTLYSKDTKNGKLRLYIRNAESEICDDLGFIAEVSLKEYDFDYVRIGEHIKIEGKFKLYDMPENEGQFDSRQYYLIRGYAGKLQKAKIIAKSYNYSLIREKLALLRNFFVHVYDKGEFIFLNCNLI